MSLTKKVAVETVTRMKALLSTPDAWTKSAAARDGAGAMVAPTEPEAVCFCLYGALRRVAHADPILFQNRSEIDEFLERVFAKHTEKLTGTNPAEIIRTINSFPGYVRFNDSESTSFEKIQEFLDEALKEASALG